MEINKIRATHSAKVPTLNFDLLLAHAIKQPKEFLYSHPEYNLSPTDYLRWVYFLWRYRRGYPVAYITHRQNFYGLDFYVNEMTLIPRPDTEVMVDEVIKKIRDDIEKNYRDIDNDIRDKKVIKNISGDEMIRKIRDDGIIDDEKIVDGIRDIEIRDDKITKETKDKNQATQDNARNILLIDVGTGSGCIPIAILKSLNNYKIERLSVHDQTITHYRITAVASDISKKALRVARRNAACHGLDIIFLHGNLLDPIIQTPQHSSATTVPPLATFQKIIISANLPYLTPQQFLEEPSIQQEPYQALVANQEGLGLYRQLLDQIKTVFDLPRALSAHHHVMTIFLEIDPRQSKKIRQLINEIIPAASIFIKKDLGGRERLVIIDI